MNVEINQLSIAFDIDAIKRDFAFIRLERMNKDRYRGAPQIDFLIGEDYNADAILYQYGRFAYAMFKRPLDTYKLISRIRKDEDFSAYAVVEVQPRGMCGGAGGDYICEAWLAQLLINSLASSRSKYKEFHYCNLTGKLLVVHDKKREYIDAINIKLDKHYRLNMNVERYRTLHSVRSDVDTRKSDGNNIMGKPEYIYHKGTDTLRRLLPRDDRPNPRDIYVQKGFDNKKAHVCFLDFSSPTAYNKSRVGILHKLLGDIQKHLSEYMSVELCDLKVLHNERLDECILKKPKDLKQRLFDQPIHIVDLVETGESKKLVKTLKNGFLGYMTHRDLLTTGKEEMGGAFNYRIIHEPVYYEENGIKDEYLASDSNILRQNITVEGVEEAHNAILKTLIKEQLIKRDLQEQNLTLFNWSGLNTAGVWSFVSYDTKGDIIFMKIHPNGRFEFEEVNPGSSDISENCQECVDLLEEAKNAERNNNDVRSLSLEGMVISEKGDRNLIYHTELIAIPNLEGIRENIKKIDDELPEGMRRGSELASVVEECFAGVPESWSRKVPNLIDILNEVGNQEISKTDFRKVLNSHLGAGSKAARHLRNTLSEKYDVRIIFSRDEKSLKEYLGASIDINYIEENGSEAYYFVGERRETIRQTINNAHHLRMVKAVNGSNLAFKDILPTLNVDFVRTGQSTVLPFPFKYIREYAKFEK